MAIPIMTKGYSMFANTAIVIILIICTSTCANTLNERYALGVGMNLPLSTPTTSDGVISKEVGTTVIGRFMFSPFFFKKNVESGSWKIALSPSITATTNQKDLTEPAVSWDSYESKLNVGVVKLIFSNLIIGGGNGLSITYCLPKGTTQNNITDTNANTIHYNSGNSVNELSMNPYINLGAKFDMKTIKIAPMISIDGRISLEPTDAVYSGPLPIFAIQFRTEIWL